MKTHTKKKLYRSGLQAKMKAGFMNDAEGRWGARTSFRDSAMVRDYHPQVKGKGKKGS